VNTINTEIDFFCESHFTTAADRFSSGFEFSVCQGGLPYLYSIQGKWQKSLSSQTKAVVPFVVIIYRIFVFCRSCVQHQAHNSKEILWEGKRRSGDNLAHDVSSVLHGEGPSELVHEHLHGPTRPVDKETLSNISD
jgi:hypothetical protein